MASWNRYKFGSSQDMLDFLNGATRGVKNLHDGADVDGKTFIFEVNGGGDTTVTFAPAKSRPWTIDEIVALINASEANLAFIRTITAAGRPLDRRIVLVKDLTSFEIKATGTANADLGFGAGSAVYIPDTQILGAPVPVPGEQDSWLLLRYV